MAKYDSWDLEGSGNAELIDVERSHMIHDKEKESEQSNKTNYSDENSPVEIIIGWIVVILIVGFWSHIFG